MKTSKKEKKNKGEAPIEPRPNKENLEIPSTSFGPKIPKVYWRKLSTHYKPDLIFPVNVAIDIDASQVVTPPFEPSPGSITKMQVPKGKETQVETKEEVILFKVFSGGKRPHTRPTNKLIYKIKLRNNPKLANEVIDVDNMPIKDLIINRKKPICSNKNKDKGTIKRGPMETRQRKK